MVGELYINNRLVDLNDSLPFPLTFNISDIRDLNSRKGNKSKTITIGGTKRNHELMNTVFLVTTTQKISDVVSEFVDFDPSIKAVARYYQNGLLEFKGIAQLMECKLIDGVWTFEITLVSDMIDYISRLTKLKINELDFSEYNHRLIQTKLKENWDGYVDLNGTPTILGDGFGYYYGLIDYGYSRPSPDTFGVDNIPPQVYVREVLDKMFKYAGISWKSKFFESKLFKRFMVAYYGGQLPSISKEQSEHDSVQGNELNNSGGFIISQAVSMYSDNGIALFPLTTLYDNVDLNVTSDPIFQVVSNTPLKIKSNSQGLFNIHYYGKHNLNFIWSELGITYVDYKLKLIVYKNGINVIEDLIYSGKVDTVTGDSSFDVLFDYNRNLNMLINDELTYEIVFEAFPQLFNISNPQVAVNIQVVSGANLDLIKSQQSITPGGTMFLNVFLPDMTCDQFLKGIITAFNLYIKPNVDDPTILEIEPLIDFYKPSGYALDWSYLVDKKKEIKVTPTINFSAKNYIFNFDQEDDFWNTRYKNEYAEQYGSFVIESQSQYATEDTLFKLPFVQHPLALIETTNLIVPRSYQVNFDEFGHGQIVLKKGKSFIVQKGRMREGEWTLIDEGGGYNGQGKYPYVGHIDDIDEPTFDFNFGVPKVVYYPATIYTNNNLLSYHNRFIQELVSRYGKMVSLYAMIDSQLINTLDFRNLINIDGVVYRLQKISDYDSGKEPSTLIELIRIIEGEGEAPPPFVDSFYRITEDDIVRADENGVDYRIIE